jgi:hypothetical protein
MQGRGDHSSSPGRVKNFQFSISYRRALGPTQLPIQLVLGGPSPEVKQQGREDDNSPPNSAEVKKTWTCISAPTIRLHGVVIN